jgi:DNA mismatch repair protein MutS
MLEAAEEPALNQTKPLKITPMMKQWLAAKEKAKDAILLFRMGDFYELFSEDALLAAPLLDLAITSRDREKSESSMAMAGFPASALPSYVSKLVHLGHKIAICEQLEDPATAKGIVKRGITRVVTPGTLIDDEELTARHSNFLVALAKEADAFGICCLELSTGEFFASTTTRFEVLAAELVRLNPQELLLVREEEPGDLQGIPLFERKLKEILPSHCRAEKRNGVSRDRVQFSLDPWFESPPRKPALHAALIIQDYIKETQGNWPSHILPLKPHILDQFMMLDASSIEALELVGPPGKRFTLANVMDKNKTAMGSRLMRRWLLAPSMDLEEINNRLDVVQVLCAEQHVSSQLRGILSQMGDLERLSSKATSKRISPRDLATCRDVLVRLPELEVLLMGSGHEVLKDLCLDFDPIEPLRELLDKALVAVPSLELKNGQVFAHGFDSVLDELSLLSAGSKELLLAVEEKERTATGISNLKIRYTRVFGYYIELTKTHLAKVPPHYTRKQTVANGERFVTPELAALEERIASADLKKHQREVALFEGLVSELVKESSRLLQNAKALARIDVLAAFATCARESRYTRPALLPSQEKTMSIELGRHPIIEKLLSEDGKPFVPNDIELNEQSCRLMVITGPNMGGKSTILRQVGLIQILAQAGSFVPAARATLSLCDRVFTRVGASDNAAKGRSTFMVEMAESANILCHASPYSLVLLDEIGRGTSTFDGVAIAFAMAEYLAADVQARAIFATHFHELTLLEKDLSFVKNFHVAISRHAGEVTFLYSLAKGEALQSLGLHVARIAGVPPKVIERASTILEQLLSQTGRNDGKLPQLDLFGNREAFVQAQPLAPAERELQSLEALAEVAVEQMTPLQALNELARLRQLAKQDMSALRLG